MTGLAAGLQCLLTLPAGASEEAVAREAADRGLLVEGLGSFRFDSGQGPHGPAMVVGTRARLPDSTKQRSCFSWRASAVPGLTQQ